MRIVAAAAGAGTIRGVTGLSVPGDSLPLSAVYRIISLTHDIPIAILGRAELKIYSEKIEGKQDVAFLLRQHDEVCSEGGLERAKRELRES